MSRVKRFALILIDPQNGFVNDGCWSSMFPDGQTIPILECFHRIVQFLRSIPNLSSIPILISQTGFILNDREIFAPIAAELPQTITCVFKPHTNLSICPGVDQWLIEQEKSSLDIVIGGCTITSCIRDSSIEMKKRFPRVNFVVDRSLCAARKDNYLSRCEECFQRYMIDGVPPRMDCLICRSNSSLSPVQFAYKQMKDAGIDLLDHYPLISSVEMSSSGED